METWKHGYRKGVIKEETIIVQFLGSVFGAMLLVLISFGVEILIAALFVFGLSSLLVVGMCSLITFLISRRSKSDPEE